MSTQPRRKWGGGFGTRLFRRECGSCHLGDGLAGPPIGLAVVGTDPTFGESPWRGTGLYQTTSLRGVASRPLLLAGGGGASLDALIAPDREIGGHRYGQTLDDADRAALRAFLRALR